MYMDVQRGRTIWLTQAIYNIIAKRLDGKGRLLLLQEMHRALGADLDLGFVATVALMMDDLPCFLYTRANGVLPFHFPFTLAAEHGAASILEYGLPPATESSWRLATLVLYWAAWSGSVECLDLVLQRFGSTVQLTWELSLTASRGHLAAVRYLHARGVPLWDSVKSTHDPRSMMGTPSIGVAELWDTAQDRIASGKWLYVPTNAPLARSFWGVMRYGEMHGAPLPESAVWVLKERRKMAREVLLCFHGAARLSRAGRTHARLWAVMAHVPVDVLCIILVGAELEIEETFRPRIAHSIVENGV
jgi:hypothetical protein